MDYKEKQLVNGREVSIIATYKDDDTNKDYIIYTDETKTDDGKLKVIYGTYKIINGRITVDRIENPEEEKKIFEILKNVTTEEI